MTYVKSIGYKKYVDFRKLDFIFPRLQSELPICSVDIRCDDGDISIPLATLGYKIYGFDMSLSNIIHYFRNKIVHKIELVPWIPITGYSKKISILEYKLADSLPYTFVSAGIFAVRKNS